jgi:hypothetical protein
MSRMGAAGRHGDVSRRAFLAGVAATTAATTIAWPSEAQAPRPRGTQLLVSGRRLDASAPPIEAHIPCCYTSGFQIVGLLFPTEGCWDVNGLQPTAAGESVSRRG